MAYLFKYYAGFYDGFMRRFGLDSNEEILKSIGEIKNKKILDVGGGTGVLAYRLYQEGAKVTLVDPSPQMTEIARKKTKAIEVYTATLEEVSQEVLREQFDFVIIRDALHHMRNPEKVIECAKDCLNTTGALIISEFNSRSKKTQLIWCFETLCFERCRMFTKESLVALCSPYFKNQQIVDTSDFEMIYKGRNTDAYEENTTTS